MNELQELKINPGFRDIIPPLTAEEYEALRESLISEGCRDAIVVGKGLFDADGVIVDGHNRYAICKENGIPFRTLEKTFADENEAIIWIFSNQIARRNLSEVQCGRLALKLKDSIAARAKENCSLGGKGLANLPNLDTRKELAKIAGIGERTLAKIERVDREAPAVVREEMGKTISIDKAARINEALKLTPEQEREKEARRLVYEEKLNKINRESKMISKLENIMSAGIIDYEYIAEDCVDVYLKQMPLSIRHITETIDTAIGWLEKLKAIFIRRDAEFEKQGGLKKWVVGS